jgi:hypothetical protein
VKRQSDDASRECPKCGFLLWVVPVPKDYVFKDLRSTYGTFATEGTGDLRFKQGVLGHAN